jgi:hypothetical protein
MAKHEEASSWDRNDEISGFEEVPPSEQAKIPGSLMVGWGEQVAIPSSSKQGEPSKKPELLPGGWAAPAGPIEHANGDDQWDVITKSPEPPLVKVNSSKMKIFNMIVQNGLKVTVIVSALIYPHDLLA